MGRVERGMRLYLWSLVVFLDQCGIFWNDFWAAWIWIDTEGLLVFNDGRLFIRV